MAGRKPQKVEVTAVNKTHRVFLFIQKHPGLAMGEYITGLTGPNSDLTPKDVRNSIASLENGTYVISKATGRGENRAATYTINEEVMYTPRPAMKRIQMNDVKARKSAERQAANVTDLSTHRKKKGKEAEPFQVVEGLAAIDPNHPGFTEIAQDLLGKVTPTEIPTAEGPVKPMVELIFLNIGNQSVGATPVQLRQLFDELSVMFGK